MSVMTKKTTPNKRTLLEITPRIENWTTVEWDRFAFVFEIEVPKQINGRALSKGNGIGQRQVKKYIE